MTQAEIKRVPYSEYNLETLQWWRQRARQVGDYRFVAICTRAIKCRRQLMIAAAKKYGLETEEVS